MIRFAHRRRGILVSLTAAALFLATGPACASPSAHRRSYPETAGGVVNTWANPVTALGHAGPHIKRGQTVRIACRVRGFKVQDGNVWWYRIASKPWSGHFYASADAFYNDGRRSGSLLQTPFVDKRVPICAHR